MIGFPLMRRRRTNFFNLVCREYFRDRPRGEFLTRGAALSSQGGGGNVGNAGRTTGVEGRGGDGRGAAGGGGHNDYGSAQRYMAVAAASQAARLGRNLSSEKLGNGGGGGGGQSEQQQQQQRQRNPTILRKSEFFGCMCIPVVC